MSDGTYVALVDDPNREETQNQDESVTPSRNVEIDPDETFQTCTTFDFGEEAAEGDVDDWELSTRNTEVDDERNLVESAAKRQCTSGSRLDKIEDTLHEMKDMMSTLFKQVESNAKCLKDIR
jgi:hypothetical protein